MDTLNLSSRLHDILLQIDHSESLEALDSLLRDPLLCQQLFEERQNRTMLGKIEAKLRPEVLRYELAREIREKMHRFWVNCEENRPGKSLHTLQGAFLWVKGAYPSLFQTPKDELLQSSIFDLMAPSSLSRLYSRFGHQLLDVTALKSRVISYEVKGVLLVSRCTPVFYTDGSFNPKLGVLLETRRSKRLPPLPSLSPQRFSSLYPFLHPSFFAQSPATPLFLGVPKEPFSTPTPLEQTPKSEECGRTEMYAQGSISPSLLYESEMVVRGFSHK